MKISEEFESFIEYVVFPPLVMLFLIIFSSFIIIYLVTQYKIEVTEKNIISVVVDGEKVYSGKKAFVDIDTSGATTTITIYEKLFPLYITERVYVSDNVSIQ